MDDLGNSTHDTQKRKKAFSCAQEVLSSLLSSSAGYFYAKDKNLNYITCNNNYLDLLGVASLNDVIRKKDIDLDLAPDLIDSFSLICIFQLEKYII